MLREIISGRKKTNGQIRLWYVDDKLDLFVFLNENNVLMQFQLCYNKQDNEHVISWSNKFGYAHNRIDTGRNTPGRAGSPLFVPNGSCDIDEVKTNFLNSSLNLDITLFEQVYRKLVGYKYSVAI